MTSDLPPPDPEDIHHDPRARRTPNYTARRVAVLSAVVGVIAVVVFAVVRLTGGGDETDEATAPGWDALVEVDRASGDVTVLDGDGEELVVVSGSGRVIDVHVRGDRIALVGREQVVLTSVTGEAPGADTTDDDDNDDNGDNGDNGDNDSGDADADDDGDGLSGGGANSDDTLVLPVSADAAVSRVPTNRSLSLVSAPPSGGNVVVIDGVTGSVLDIGAAAGERSPLLLPETLRVDPDGDRFAVGDGRNFQTIVAGFGDDEASFYPGVPVALDDDLVVTSLVVGRNAELRLFDPRGDATSVVATQRPVGGVVDGRRVVYVTEDGGVSAATLGSSNADELADLELATVDWALPALDGDRLVVAGGNRLMVIDLAGDVVFDTTVEAETPRPWATWRCLPVIGTDGGIIDLRNGEVVADVAVGDIAAVSTDGCGVHVTVDDGGTITSPSGTIELDDPVRSVVLAPDGSAAMVTAPDGTTELVDVGDRRRLDLGVRRGLLAFARR